jgi:hypothetical protein
MTEDTPYDRVELEINEKDLEELAIRLQQLREAHLTASSTCGELEALVAHVQKKSNVKESSQ